MRRDAMCIAALLDRSHQCQDKWGESHLPSEMGKLTLEHVRTDPGGKRRHDAGHLLALCARSNDQHWSSSTENRALLNAYLAGCRAAAA